MKPFAAFDIDGTLIRWQLYHAIVDHLAQKNLLGPDAKEHLHQARMKWKRREHPGAWGEYELAVISTFEAAFDTLSTEDFDIATKEVTQEYGNQTYVYTRNLIKNLKHEGYFLVAISGSQHEIVGHIAQQYGFDDWVGTNYHRANDRFHDKPFVASHDKAAVLTKLIQKHSLKTAGSLAIGDSASDAAMFELVDQPIAFNPDQALYDLARKHGWKIVLERKSVIYELEATDGHYQLA